jgi:teichuronic acid biosynthesis glycosyltransferase TuaG
MIDNPLVSIIMPCYKAARTLEKSVRSIRSQTYINWELLLLDDGSPDNTLLTASTLAAADPRIRLISSRKNRGVVSMRNIGIRLSKGDWIAFCDADDWWEPEKLHVQLAAAMHKKANLVYSAVYYVKEHRKVQQKEVQLHPNADYDIMQKTNAIPMSSSMYSRKALGRHYFSPQEKGLIHEDYAYWLQLFKTGKVVSAYIDIPTAFIRMQKGSRSSNKIRAVRSHAKILRQESNLPYTTIVRNMFVYFFTAAKKRMPW